MNETSARRRVRRFFSVILCGIVGWLALPGMIFAQVPAITTQPASATVFYGDPVTFRAVASGSAPLGYQWYRDGLAISAATGSAYTVSMTRSNDAGAGFKVRVANGLGAVTSTVATLTVDFGTLGSPQSSRLMTISNTWSYNVNAAPLPEEWRGLGYDEGTWSSGRALLYTTTDSRTSSITGGPLSTSLGLTPGSLPTTCYFRAHFTNPAPASSAVNLSVTTVVDDGVVVYLNGGEAFRLAVTNSAVAYSDYASRTAGDAAAEGPAGFQVTNLVSGDNLLAAEVHQCNATSGDIVWGMALDAVIYPRLRDTTVPTVTKLIPAAGSTVTSLKQIEVQFSEGVKGVRAADLLIKGSPATNVTAYAPYDYVFDFPQPATGLVQVVWSASQNITDLSANSNRFAGGSYSYTLDPGLLGRSVRINEFMAGNEESIRDDDGHHSDWIELYNAGDSTVSLAGWYLSDNPEQLTKWRIPSGISMTARSYLLIWASGNDRTNAAAALHTNFKLSKSAGSSLLLVQSDGATIVSAFSSYPEQYDDVSYGCDRVTPTLVGYFTTATPRGANATLGPGFGPEVQFSVPGGSFQQPFTLSLSTTDPTATIRYVLVTNGSSAVVTMVPDASSPIYSGALTVSGSTQVRARAFSASAGYFPGPLRNETYIQIGSSAAGFSSDLPIVVFHDMGGGAVAATEEQFMTMEVYDVKNGRSSLLNPPDVVVQGYFHRRGQATFWNPKANLRVETQDAYGDDLDVALLGMPAQSDWVFYGINCYDKVLMHNPLAFDLYQQMGHYSSNTRYVEVFLKDDAGTPGPITSSEYNGLYVVEEKIKIGKHRVDIDKLQPENATAPSVTGGYLLSIDKSNPEMQDYLAGAWVWYLDPDFSTVYVPAQVAYIQDYFSDFYNALMGANWTNPVTGYAPYIDMSSWIDYHLHQTFVFNADMLRISSYFYKPRSGPIVQGPLWDFDRAFCDSNDGRGFNPRRWRSGDGDGGTDPFNPCNTFENPWYGRMFRDPDFWQRWIDRYQELRTGVYHLTNLMERIDYYGEQVREATAREYARWRGSGGSDTSPRAGTMSADGFTYSFPVPGTWQGELDFVKYWFSNRVAFFDSNFLNPPTFSTNGGLVPSGYPMTITASTVEANSTIYYTLDGTDPRLPGGGVNPAAFSKLNSKVLTINTNTRVFARNFNTAHHNLTGANNPPISSSWSGPRVATFYTSIPPLRISELMFNPAAPPAGNTNSNENFEYIEFQNTSGASINLRGYCLSGGVDFTFGNYVLGAGKYVLVVRDQAAFQSRYPGVTNIAGAYTNNLENAGERLVLSGPLQEPVLDFSYNDTWFVTTDGLGFALVARDPNAPVTSWNSQDGWRVGSVPNGTPGAAEPAPPAVPAILVTEALTHTDPPEVDSIELFNPSTNRVDLGGWFLSDDRHEPKKFRFAAGTYLSPGGYGVYTTNDFGIGTNGFELSSVGDAAYLFSGDANTNLTGYGHGFDFGPAPNGISFGRYLNSQGAEQFVLQSVNTLGTNNASPRVGPIVVSELMYHPPDLYAGQSDYVNEYIELSSIASTNVPLYDPNAATNTWRLRNAVDFDFPGGVTLPPGGRLLVVGFDPVRYPSTRAGFVAKYGVPDNVPIYGPWDGKLDNAGEDIELRRPDNPNVTPTNVFVPYYLVERIGYGRVTPWPTNADGGGASLQRVQNTHFGNEPTNWVAVAPFFGKPTRPNITVQPTNTTVFGGNDLFMYVVANGSTPLKYQWYWNGTNALGGETNTTLVITNIQMSQWGNYHAVVTNSLGSVTSQVAVVNVVALPVIASQPADQTVPIGGTADFEVVATGNTLTYQWFYNTNTVMPGSGANLLLFSVQPSQSGTYHVQVSNPYGSVRSRYAVLTVANLPVITAQPTNLTVLVGGGASFAVSATGSGPLAYQWFLNGTTPLEGRTDTNLVFPVAQLTDAGLYHVVVSNASGSVASAAASLRVLVAPAIDASSLVVSAGGVTVSLNSVAGLDYTLEYKSQLTDSNWTALLPAVAGNGGVIRLTDTNVPAASSRFYRVNCD
jgi:hypothetical protein